MTTEVQMSAPVPDPLNDKIRSTNSTPKKQHDQDVKMSSPDSAARGNVPKIIVKKEPASPTTASVQNRHRPPKLALAQSGPSNITSQTPRTGNLTANGVMQEVGLACLSPGFNTQDPAMREQLQRSISVREQQRSIIEQRLQRHAKDGGDVTERDNGPKTSTTRGDRSAKRRPPSSLTIVPPSHRAFANERVVQSAPLNQSFTGRDRPPPHLAQHPHHPQQQNMNRLPPIADVFAGERMDLHRTPRFNDPPTTTNNAAPKSSYPPPIPAYPSPNHTANNFPRPREYRSAEEAVAVMTGGREELLPRIIHYGGHQPPTPPSPPQGPQTGKMNGAHMTGGGRRRARGEYERDGSYGSDDNGTKRRKKDEKKEEFLALCARAWDLFHS